MSSRKKDDIFLYVIQKELIPFSLRCGGFRSANFLNADCNPHLPISIVLIKIASIYTHLKKILKVDYLGGRAKEYYTNFISTAIPFYFD
jgi:hypothetical protein